MTFWLVSVLLFAATATTQSQERSAEEILADIMAVEIPTYESVRAKEPQYQDEFSKKLKAAIQQRCDLIRELYLTDKTHWQLPDLMPERWSMLISHLEKYDIVIRETEKILASAPEEFGPSFLVRDAMFIRGKALMKKAQGGPNSSPEHGEVENAQLLKAINTFVEKYPTDKRAGSMLDLLAQYLYVTDNRKEAKAIWQRLLRDYADHVLANDWKGKLRRLDSLSKPFELTFTDALSGNKISMGQLRGKVVVIDFWATWCLPCIAEIPHLRSLYAEYKNKDVEFIGVSTDEGSRKAFIRFCKDNGIIWPQYHQRDGIDSEFSQSWGITEIPIMFVVDRQGNLYSVSARGKLDTMLPKLLEVK